MSCINFKGGTMGRKLIALVLFLVVGCAPITKMEVATDLLIAADYLQTRQIAKNPGEYHEHNLYLGEHPSEGRVNGYFAACLLGNTLLHRVIPERYLPYYQTGLIAVQVGAIANNYSVGLKVKF